MSNNNFCSLPNKRSRDSSNDCSIEFKNLVTSIDNDSLNSYKFYENLYNDFKNQYKSFILDSIGCLNIDTDFINMKKKNSAINILNFQERIFCLKECSNLELLNMAISNGVVILKLNCSNSYIKKLHKNIIKLEYRIDDIIYLIQNNVFPDEWINLFKEKYIGEMQWKSYLETVKENRYNKHYFPEILITDFNDQLENEFFKTNYFLKKYHEGTKEYQAYISCLNYSEFQITSPLKARTISVKLFNISKDELYYPNIEVIYSCHSALHSLAMLIQEYRKT